MSFEDDLEGEFLGHEHLVEVDPEWRLNNVCAAEGKPPAAPAGVYASETDRTYVVLSWKAPAYSSKAPMWYYIEKVPHEWMKGCVHCCGPSDD